MTFAQGYILTFAGYVALAWIIGFALDYLSDAFGGR